MKPAAAMLVAWLALSPLLLFLGYSSASSGFPYLGVLRGWENKEGINESGFDIAVDEQNIYIVGYYFEGKAGYGPTLLIVLRDHTSPVICQRALVFDVSPDRLDRWVATSLDINSTHVAVAGWYAVDTKAGQFITFFIAVYTTDCQFTGIVEIGRFRPSGVSPWAVVKFDSDGDIYLLVSPTNSPESRGTIFLYRLDQYLNIIGNLWYYVDGYSRVSAYDMAVSDDAVYIVGDVWQERPEGIFLIKIDKDTLGAINHTILVGDSLSLFYPHIAVDSDGYIYVAASGFSFSSDSAGPVLFKLDSRFNLVFTEPNIIGFKPTHRDANYPYQGLPFALDLDVSDTQVFIVGGIEHASGNDGFVVVANKTDGKPFYFLKIVSRENDAYKGGARVNSAAYAVNVYLDCAYITGYAENYYLEYEPLNPTATPNPVRSTTSNIIIGEETPILEKKFDREISLNPLFDQDAYTGIKGNGFYGVLCMSPATARSITTSTSTTTSTVTSTLTSTTTETSTSTVTSTTTSTTTRTVTSTPTTTVTWFTTSTQTAVATVVQTEYVFSTVYTTRVVEGTVTRVETVTSVTTIPNVTTLTDTTTVRSVVTATTTPTVYATVQTTVLRNMTTYLTTTKAVQPPDTVPWWYILFPFIPLLLLPPVVVTTRGRLKITILEGAGEQQPGAQPSDILSEYFKPSVGRLQKNGKATFINKDRATHTVEIYTPEEPGRIKTLTLKPGQKAQIKFKEPGRYFFRLQTNPDKIGILQVE
jgi:plastocyanin